MADVTGGTPPTNASPFAVPADIKAVYDHFGDQAKYSVATAASLPATGNWLGRYLTAQDTTIPYVCTALPSTWVQAHLLADTGWTAATLQNSWANFGGTYGSAAYRRLNGQVFLRGVVKDGSITSGTAVLTLPAGYRPGSTRRFVSVSSTGFAVLEVNTAGQVLCNVVGSNASLSLDALGPFIAEA